MHGGAQARAVGRAQQAGIGRLYAVGLIAGARQISLLRLAQEDLATRPGNLGMLGALGFYFLVDADIQGTRMFGQVGKLTHQPGIQQRAQRVMHRLQLQIHQCIVQIRHAPPVEMITKPVPGLLRSRVKFPPIEKYMALVGVQVKGQSAPS